MGQQNVGVCGMATWEWAHSHGFRILSKANELKADLPTSKLSFQVPSWAETSCKAPKAPWKFAWRTFVLTKLKPRQSVSFSSRMLMLHSSPSLGATEGLWMLKMQMSLNFLFHIQNQPDSGWRQSTHWTRELFLKNKQKTQNLVNSTSTPTAEVCCPNHLTPRWVWVCRRLSEVTFGPIPALVILFLPCEFRTRHFHVKHHVSQKRASCLDTGTHVHLSVVLCAQLQGRGTGWFLAWDNMEP